MRIISHRGLWLDKHEKNANSAFRRSFELGFGIETDIRDNFGELVISHDMPIGIEESLEDLLIYFKEFDKNNELSLALNIKADGLASYIAPLVHKYCPGSDVFAFDMSIPDMLNYINLGVPVFTRMSEIEINPVLLSKVAGVWLDSFYTDWFDNFQIDELTRSGKRVCVVSPELHGRPYMDMWMQLKEIDTTALLICTDEPLKAFDFFR